MFEQTRFITSNFNIIFARRERIRRDANTLEDKLQEFADRGIRYFQPQVIPVPDELDPRVPRIIFGSEHGFSQILVSQVSLSLQVTYSPDWQIAPESGRDYLRERAAMLFELFRALNHGEPNFCGLSSVARIPSRSSDDELIRQLSRNLLTLSPQMAVLRDVHVRTSRIVGDRFFHNITIENYRDWQLPIESLVEAVPLSYRQAVGRGVSITGDLNDRQAFNEQDNYRSSETAAQEIITLAFGELESQIEELRG